jgi:hypothetical protein|tara:strand:- start:394 stop:516 length:123 start_codon:yes stop_codon:yes gene_type:complete
MPITTGDEMTPEQKEKQKIAIAVISVIVLGGLYFAYRKLT